MVGSVYRILPDPNIGGSLVRTTVVAQANAGDVTIRVGSVTGLSNGDHVLINGHEYTLSNVVPDPTTTVAVQANPTDAAITVASVALLNNGDTVEIAGNQYTISNI